MDANIAVTQFTAAGVAVYALQLLKQSKYFPFLKNDSARWVKIAYSIVTAIGVHTGIAAVWTHSDAPVGFQYQLVINIPPISAMAVEVWHWIGQYVMQEGWYQVAFNRVTLTSSPHGMTVPAQVTAEGALVVPKEN
jgi:hypothetical protein